MILVLTMANIPCYLKRFSKNRKYLLLNQIQNFVEFKKKVNTK